VRVIRTSHAFYYYFNYFFSMSATGQQSDGIVAKTLEFIGLTFGGATALKDQQHSPPESIRNNSKASEIIAINREPVGLNLPPFPQQPLQPPVVKQDRAPESSRDNSKASDTIAIDREPVGRILPPFPQPPSQNPPVVMQDRTPLKWPEPVFDRGLPRTRSMISMATTCAPYGLINDQDIGNGRRNDRGTKIRLANLPRN
jgi:hypothetical protein